MPRDVAPRSRPALDGRRHGAPWALALCTAVIVASQAWPWSLLLPLLPSTAAGSRSPSSDVLMQALPMTDAASTIDAVADTLPLEPGIVVGHGTSDRLASAYMVLAMRLWPRPVSFVACQPVARVEQFRVPHPVPAPAWRIDLVPGDADPLRVSAAHSSDAADLCAAPLP